MVERALLVRICFDKREEEESRSLLNELAELVGTLGIGVVGDELVRARQTQKKFLCGKGKAEEGKGKARQGMENREGREKKRTGTEKQAEGEEEKVRACV